MKTQKLISIDDNILESIQERKLNCGFNFSEWVENRYINEFLNIERLEQDYIKYNTKLTDIKNTIKELKKLPNTNVQDFTDEEQTYIKRIPILLKEGKNINAVTKRFNFDFKKKLTVQQLKNMIDKLINANQSKAL